MYARGGEVPVLTASVRVREMGCTAALVTTVVPTQITLSVAATTSVVQVVMAAVDKYAAYPATNVVTEEHGVVPITPFAEIALTALVCPDGRTPMREFGLSASRRGFTNSSPHNANVVATSHCFL